jgi:hypothetical protein
MAEAAARSLRVTLRHFDGCPHWRTAHERLRQALREEGLSHVEPILERLETPDEAERLRFVGSPTILVNGRDPFAGIDESFGMSCRVYQTPEGLAGSPTVEQLREVLRSA